MRMGAFLLGGVVGAVAASYWMRNGRSTSMLTSLAKAGNKMGDTMNMMTPGRSGQGSASPSSSRYESSDSAFESGRQKIESIINSNPEIKEQVDAIMNQGDDKSSSNTVN